MATAIANALCEVCTAAPATVVCCADEAAMCDACNESVHSGNKILQKHVRVPFEHAATGGKPERPPCDICQQAKALFVCCEDRAYLCRTCDHAVHSANAAAGAHARWFLNTARVALEAVPEPPSQPLGRAAAVKAAAAARAAAAAAAAAQPGGARKAASSAAAVAPPAASNKPQLAPPSLLQQRHVLPRVPSFASLDASLGMSDLLTFDKEALLGGSRDLAAMGKLGSVGDLAAMFEGSERDGGEAVMMKQGAAADVIGAGPAAEAKRDSGVVTPPLGGAPPAAEDELSRAAKRLRA